MKPKVKSNNWHTLQIPLSKLALRLQKSTVSFKKVQIDFIKASRKTKLMKYRDFKLKTELKYI